MAFLYRALEKDRRKRQLSSQEPHTGARIAALSDPTLPQSPYKLRASFFVATALQVLLFAAFAALGIALLARTVFPEGQSIARERAIWQRGVTAAEVSVEGTHTMRNIVFHEYKLDVTYLDSSGEGHAGQLAVTTLGSQLELTDAVEVHFDPAQPDQFALSSAIDVGSARWASVSVSAAVALTMVGVFGFAGIKMVQKLGDARRTACGGEWVEVTLSAPPVRNDHYGYTTYSFRVGPYDARDRTAVFGRKRQPVFIGDDCSRLLALRNREDPEGIIVLRSDLYPLALSANERERWGSP
ncbi:hypothetical protein LVJ94_32905 [Pendulispora rubella]|uniref:DUF3592 domain-containing protein n=1 Tax=Pendulispora rubella TaxID=2741070 RepID=A0ABZ2KSR2_9BACT